MKQIVWSQWSDLNVPDGFTAYHPGNMSLDSDSLDQITFYVPQYMGGRNALAIAEKMKSLKYLQLPNAGYEDALEFINDQVVLCNARGVHDDSTAELAVALTIGSRRGFADFNSAQNSGIWAHKKYSSFNESKVLIIGAGSIGSTIEKYLSVYNVEIIKFSRSGSNNSERIENLDNFLPTADVVILILPLNNESKGLFNKERLALMKDGATIVNVARGPIIDTDALVVELNSGRLFAGLDVTDPEPLPSDHPLWKAKNCIITPHVGGDSTAFDSRCRRLVEAQLRRLAAGEKLINIVN
jgi:phosphoglycerate dehydrogenase-like enzyme